MNYYDFLKSKIKIVPDNGFDVDVGEFSPVLKPHERDSILWMIRGGRRVLFSSFGLGKTITQLEVMRVILNHEKGKALIIVPLAVVHVFQDNAQHLLNRLEIKYIKSQSEAEAEECRLLITNYERVRDGDINPAYFIATTLDEASVLRSYGSKTYQEFLSKFSTVK
jgi:hypothetical protein